MRRGVIRRRGAGPEPGVVRGREMGGRAGQHCKGKMMRQGWSIGIKAEGDEMAGQYFKS